MKFKLFLLLFITALTAMLAPNAAHADLGYWSQNLVGFWKHPVSYNLYHFDSDATYSVMNNRSDDGYIKEEGWWKIVKPTEAESGGSSEGPVALVLKMRKRTTQVNGKSVTRSMVRDSRHVVDTFADDEGTNSGFYLFDGAKLQRFTMEIP